MTTTEPITAGTEPLPPATSARPSASALVAITGRQALVALRVLVAMTVIVGIAYPLVVLGVGQLVTHDAANGSMITDSTGSVAGSRLIGQQFTDPQWFAGRPSAAGTGYDAMSSGGSNLAADSPTLLTQVQQLRAQIAADNGVDPADVPADAVTASASGLDPDISPAYALLQVNRVAGARDLPAAQVRDLVQASIQGRLLGFIGEERVNVLDLNLALQQLSATSGSAPAGTGG